MLRVPPTKALCPLLCDYAIPHLRAFPHALALPWPPLGIYSDTAIRAAPCTDRLPFPAHRAYPMDTRLAIPCDSASVRFRTSARSQKCVRA